MALKFFLLALLVTYSAQGLNAENAEIEDTRGLIEAVKALVEKSIELIKTTIDSIKEIAKSLYDSLQEQAKEEIKKALESLLGVKNDALKALKELAEKAAGLGKEAENCVVSRKDELTDLFESTQRETLKCIDRTKYEVKRVVINVKNVVERSLKTVSGLLNDFKACEKILCQVGVVTKGIGAVKNIRENMEAVLNEARSVLKIEIPRLVECTSNVAEDYQKEVLVIVGEIAECVNNLDV